MEKTNAKVARIDPMDKRYKKSFMDSWARRQEAKKATKEKRQGTRYLRRRMGAAAAVLTLGVAGGAAAINALQHDGSPIDHRVTVQFGDTLSGIAESELMSEGDPDPDTAEINAEAKKIAEANPEGISSGGTAVEGAVLNIPK